MYLIFRNCDYWGCEQAILGDEGTCEFCGEVRCFDHDTLPFHSCCSMDAHFVNEIIAKTDREMWEKFLAPLDHTLFENQASALRPGHSCEIRIPQSVDEVLEAGLFNQFNGHFPAIFDDGVKWLLRLRQITKLSATGDMQSIVTTSEAETMRVLHKAGLLVPNAWTVCEEERIELEPGIKYDYFFVECAVGQAWKKLNKSSGEGNPSADSLKTFIDAYARFQISLSHLPFNRIGSLAPSNSDASSPHVGPLISHFGFNRPEPPYFFGPFKTNRERYLTHIDLVLELIEAGVHMQDDPVYAYLAHLHLRDVVVDLEELAQEETEFYVKHADDKADQCLAVDDEITAVIDWEWAYVTTKAEAFSPPKMCFGSAAHMDGDNAPDEIEKLLVAAYLEYGREDLADCVRNGRIYNRLARSVGYAPIVWELNALTRAAYGEDTTAMIYKTAEEWQAAAKEKYKDNEALQRLIRQDEGKAGPRAARLAEYANRVATWKTQLFPDDPSATQSTEPDTARDAGESRGDGRSARS